MTDTTIVPDALEDEEVTVLLDDDALLEVDASLAPDDGEKPLSTKPADGLAELQAQLQAKDESEAKLRTDAETARRERAQAIADAARLAEENANLHKTGIDSKLAEANRELDDLTAKQAAFMETGEYTEATKLNGQIAKLGARIDRIESEKDAPPRVEHRQAMDPVEAFASTRTPASAEWIRANRNYIQPNGAPHPALVAADTLATHKGHAPDTPEYFAFLETQLGLKKPDAEPAPVIPAKPAPRSAPMTAAPVTRSAAPSTQPRNPGEVTLTRNERELADSMGVSYKEYATEKLKIQRQAQS